MVMPCAPAIYRHPLAYLHYTGYKRGRKAARMDNSMDSTSELSLELRNLPDINSPYSDIKVEKPAQDVIDLNKPEKPAEVDKKPKAPKPKTPVYGVNMPAHAAAVPKKRRNPLLIIACLAAIIALAAGAALYLPKKLAQQQPEPLVQHQPVATQKVEKQTTTAPNITLSDITALVGTMHYGTEDVSLPADRVTVEINKGKVVATHTLAQNETIDAQALFMTSAKRSATLASALTDKIISNNADEKGSKFKGLTWVVRAADGNALLTIAQQPGALPTNEGLDQLTAMGYALSPSLFEALGANPGIAQYAGETPTDLAGNAIEVTAVVPKTETQTTEPEPQPTVQQTTEPESTQETQSNNSYSYDNNSSSNSSDNDNYSYNDNTYSDDDYTPPAPAPEPTPEPDDDEPGTYIIDDDDGGSSDSQPDDGTPSGDEPSEGE